MAGRMMHLGTPQDQDMETPVAQPPAVGTTGPAMRSGMGGAMLGDGGGADPSVVPDEETAAYDAIMAWAQQAYGVPPEDVGDLPLEEVISRVRAEAPELAEQADIVARTMGLQEPGGIGKPGLEGAGPPLPSPEGAPVEPQFKADRPGRY